MSKPRPSLPLLFLALASAFFALPLVWISLTALRPEAELWSFPPWLPTRLDLSSARAVAASAGYLRSLGNSAAVSLLSLGLTLALACPGAYALARLPMRGKRAWLMIFLSLSLLPVVSIAGGLHQVFATLNLSNSWAALVLPLSALQLPFSLWVLSAAFEQVPRELEEAAWIDGCGRLGGFWHAFLPAARAPLASAALLAVAFFFNDFMLALVLTFDASARTAPVAVAMLEGSFEQPWGQLCAAAVMAALPMLLLTAIFQRRLVAGLSAGMGKEA